MRAALLSFGLPASAIFLSNRPYRLEPAVPACLLAIPAAIRPGISCVVRFGLLVLLISAAPGVASAQEQSHWVVGTTFSPKWTGNENLSKTVGWDGELEGSEFTVGVGRWSTRGGDWTINFVNKRIDDQTSVETEAGCEQGRCFTTTETKTTEAVTLRGLEFLWSGSFVTIANRVQLGVNVGGGYAKARGTVLQTFTFSNTFVVNPRTGQTQSFTDSTTEQRPAAEIFYSTVPLFTAEGQVGFILAPSFKVKVAAGLNNPGYGVRISAVYLIGG
jgi:hypothetical protein